LALATESLSLQLCKKKWLLLHDIRVIENTVKKLLSVSKTCVNTNENIDNFVDVGILKAN